MKVMRWLPLLSAVVAAGCGTVTPIPSDTFYRLDLPRTVNAQARPWTEDRIGVTSLQAGGLLKDRALAEADAAGVALHSVPYHYWLDSPERLLKDALVAYLRARAAAPVVLGDDASGAALQISGRVLRFERVAVLPNPQVRVALELVLRHRARVVLAREYSRTTDVRTTAVSDAVAAIAASVAAIYGDFAADADRVLSGPEASAAVPR